MSEPDSRICLTPLRSPKTISIGAVTGIVCLHVLHVLQIEELCDASKLLLATIATRL